jgi:aminoglycoside phosphotransferase (APT) family kinase protein
MSAPPPSDPVAALRGALEAAVADTVGAPARAEGPRLLTGGASQETWAVDLVVEGGPHAGRHALVLRRDLGGALGSTVLTRAEEFAVQRVVHAAGLPVPRPLWFFPHLGGDGRAAFLMERLDGETIGRRIVREPGLAAARERLPGQMAAVLAAIHRLDPAALGLGPHRAPAPGQSAAAWLLDRLTADLRASDEPHPALELALRWLHARVPAPAPVVVVHGDFRVGNVLVGPEGLRAVLDWENVYLGDPHADLAWVCVRAWRHGQDRLPVGGVGEREPFLRAYAAHGGRPVDPARLFYWEVLGNVQWAIGALGQARRHLSGAAPSIELAALGRVCAEMELEALDLIAGHEEGRHAG